MNFKDYELTNLTPNQELHIAKALPALMAKVYVWMTLALVITGIAAYMVASSTELTYAIFSNKVVFFGLIIAEFALVIGISAGINKLSLQTATLLFILYSVVNGATLSVIFLAFESAVITKVFFITAATFAAMAVVGYTTKKDLSSMGRILLMALIGLIIAMVVNMFMGSSMLDMVISFIGVLVFVGLTAYDTQKIKQMLLMSMDTGETAHKIALLGALTLYLDFINLFLYLLRLFGSNRD